MTSFTPFEWELDVGTVWHSVQAKLRDRVAVERCFMWAPTPRTVVAVAPVVSTGGAAASCGFSVVAARVAVPWQEVQVIATTSTTPFMWVARFTVVAV